MGDPLGRRVMLPAVDGTVSLKRPLATPVGLEVMYFSFLISTDTTAANTYAGIRLEPSNGFTHTFAGKPHAGATDKWVIEDLGGANQRSFQSFPVVPGRAARLVVRAHFGSMKSYTDVAPDMPEYYYRDNAYHQLHPPLARVTGKPLRRAAPVRAQRPRRASAGTWK